MAAKKYLTFFKMRFVTGLQYRAAALAGVFTQFFWGLMEILVFRAFYAAAPENFPMAFEAVVAYVWLQQAFLAFFGSWMMENDIFASIVNGNIAYELCRPVNIYDMWLSRSFANRISKAVLRCFPVLLVAAVLPEPFGMRLPADLMYFLLFLVTMLFGLTVMILCCMMIYMLAFFTISPDGLRMLYISLVDFLSGAIIPLPFLPDGLRKIVELLPFASMQNVPFRIYSGSLTGSEMARAVALQVFWIVTLFVGGKLLCRRAMKKVIVQGG